jgi:hypothetical protein
LIASAILMSAIERKCAWDRPDADVLRRATASLGDGVSEAAKRWRNRNAPAGKGLTPIGIACSKNPKGLS